LLHITDYRQVPHVPGQAADGDAMRRVHSGNRRAVNAQYRLEIVVHESTIARVHMLLSSDTEGRHPPGHVVVARYTYHLAHLLRVPNECTGAQKLAGTRALRDVATYGNNVEALRLDRVFDCVYLLRNSAVSEVKVGDMKDAHGHPASGSLCLEPGDNGLGELLGAGITAQVARTHTVLDGPLQCRANSRGLLHLTHVVEHEAARKQQCSGIGNALARDVRSGSMHRLENGHVLPDVRARCKPEPAYQSGNEVRQDVTELVGGNQDVVPVRINHQLHSGGVHHPILELHPALVLSRYLAPHLEKEAGGELQ